MKLLGFDSMFVTRLLLIETALLGLGAALTGVLVAWLVVQLGHVSISVEGFTMYPGLTGRIVIAAMVTGLILSTVAAFLPARGCSRRSIVEALRGVD